jgi:hypothetical protein
MSALIRVTGLSSDLRDFDDFRVLAYHPASDAFLFGQVWRAFAWSSLYMLYLVSVIYVSLGSARPRPLDWWLGMAGLSVLHWLTILAISVTVVAYFPNWAYRWRSRFGGLFGLLFLITLAMLFNLGSINSLSSPVAGPILLAVPTGWAGFLYGQWLEGGLGHAWGVLIAAVALVVPLPFAYRRLKQGYRIREFAIQGDLGYTAVLEGSECSEDVCSPESAWEERPGLGPLNGWPDLPEIHEPSFEAADVGRLLRAGIDWRGQGWIERAVGAWLTPRERLIIEWLLPDAALTGLRWTEQWRKWTPLLLGVLAAFAAAPSVLARGAFAPFLFGFLVYLVACVGFSILGAPWGTTSLSRPLSAIDRQALPVGYREVSWAVLKMTRVRLLAWLPLALIAGPVLAWKLDAPSIQGAVIAIKVVYFVVMAQPLWVVLLFDAGTTHPFGLRPILHLWPAVVLAVLVFLAGGILLFVPGSWPLTAAGVVILAISSYVAWDRYGRWYERGPVDVNRMPA